MSKKVLMLAAKANMIQQFNHRNINILQDLGYEVHVATNMIDFGSMSATENERFKQWMSDNQVIAHQIDFERRMGSLKGNIQSIKQLRTLFKQDNFSFIHVHSPLGSILGRLVAKQFKVPVIYTAHGFHFFKGASKLAWLVFYPLEWAFSFITDTLITINDEDYALANKHMHAKRILKINGIGVDVERALLVTNDCKKAARQRIRHELNIPDDAFLMSSVGELSDRKNHKIVLEALKMIPLAARQNIYYIIAGTGSNSEMLTTLANSFDFGKQFKLLGYRRDIHEINYASDVSVFPSFQEGLGIAGLDATIDGTYLIGSNRRGISDYIKQGINGSIIDPSDAVKLKTAILDNISCQDELFPHNDLVEFGISKVDQKMTQLYKELL
ncbi:glycosyltransferase [Leuconostoc sp. MS02]|uniref:Glycosyltransferase n=1 Tax=Leuconostoc aquikimchii TaxID=3236804 RepID=A0ABV3S3J9_9LACO